MSGYFLPPKYVVRCFDDVNQMQVFLNDPYFAETYRCVSITDGGSRFTVLMERKKDKL